jgi:hypothetical protein
MKMPSDATLQQAYPNADLQMLKASFSLAIAKSNREQVEAKTNVRFYEQIGQMMEVSLSEPGQGCYTEKIPFV